ncbi:MAG: hypothetical protein ACR2MP_03245 [Streptosporangiaceae bacterium]
MPPAIARLLGEQADVAAVQPSASVAGSAWLFPSQSGPRPVTAAKIINHLNRHGIYVRAGRTAALIGLAGQLPSAVLASLLGLAPVTADRWSRRIASDWAVYPRPRPRPG